MQKKYIISYASEGYYATQKRFVKSAKGKGLRITSYTDKWLKKKEFYRKNSKILDEKRGGGYWLWKPYIILDAFDKIDDGAFVIYCDADAVVLSSFDILFQLCEKNNGILIFDNLPHVNKAWTKRDCFILMNADLPNYHNAFQAMGGFQVFQKNELSKSFLEDWLRYSCDERILTDTENTMGQLNFPEFKEHRHDQSVLSILALKYKLDLFRDPSQYGDAFKLAKYRNDNDFLEMGCYDENRTKVNSPYNTLIELRENVFEKKSLINKLLNRLNT